MTEQPSITFKATVRQVKTLVDGGLVFIFDAPETAIQQAAQLIATKNAGIVMNVVCTAEGFTKKQAEKEILTLEQKIDKTNKEIEEKESDLEFTD